MTKTSKNIFIIYLFFLVWLIMFKFSVDFPRFFAHASGRSLNFIPFYRDGGTREILLNLVAFVPLGWFLRKVGRLKILTSVLVILAVTLSFETLQYIFAIGATDINDVMMNSLGGLIGLGLYQLLKDRASTRVGTLLEILLLILMLLVFLVQSVHGLLR